MTKIFLILFLFKTVYINNYYMPRVCDSVELSKSFVSVNYHSAMTSMVEVSVILVIQIV